MSAPRSPPRRPQEDDAPPRHTPADGRKKGKKGDGEEPGADSVDLSSLRKLLGDDEESLDESPPAPPADVSAFPAAEDAVPTSMDTDAADNAPAATVAPPPAAAPPVVASVDGLADAATEGGAPPPLDPSPAEAMDSTGDEEASRAAERETPPLRDEARESVAADERAEPPADARADVPEEETVAPYLDAKLSALIAAHPKRCKSTLRKNFMRLLLLKFEKEWWDKKRGSKREPMTTQIKNGYDSRRDEWKIIDLKRHFGDAPAAPSQGIAGDVDVGETPLGADGQPLFDDNGVRELPKIWHRFDTAAAAGTKYPDLTQQQISKLARDETRSVAGNFYAARYVTDSNRNDSNVVRGVVVLDPGTRLHAARGRAAYDALLAEEPARRALADEETARGEEEVRRVRAEVVGLSLAPRNPPTDADDGFDPAAACWASLDIARVEAALDGVPPLTVPLPPSPPH